jgi:hypothetical protein
MESKEKLGIFVLIIAGVALGLFVVLTWNPPSDTLPVLHVYPGNYVPFRSTRSGLASGKSNPGIMSDSGFLGNPSQMAFIFVAVVLVLVLGYGVARMIWGED